MLSALIIHFNNTLHFSSTTSTLSIGTHLKNSYFFSLPLMMSMTKWTSRSAIHYNFCTLKQKLWVKSRRNQRNERNQRLSQVEYNFNSLFFAMMIEKEKKNSPGKEVEFNCWMKKQQQQLSRRAEMAKKKRRNSYVKSKFYEWETKNTIIELLCE